jgi:hypothetical protein
MPLNPAAPAGNLQEQSGKDAPAVIKTAESPISPLVNEFGKQVIRLPDYHSQGAALDTLRVEMFDVQNDDESLWVDLSWWNSDFINQGSIRSVCVNENRRKMDYKLWAQPDKPNAQLIFIIPGLGSHCLSQTAGAFAEVLFQRGYTVVTMSSSMNWEFMESAATTLVPGYTPVDAEDVRNAIAAISKDLAENEAIIPERKHILGYSLGALHTLFIAKTEKNDNKLGIDHYIAINPPVDLRYGMSKIDAYYSSWQVDKTAEQALEQGLDAMGKYMIIMKKRHPWKVNFELNNQDLKQNDKSAPAVDGNAKNIYQIDMTEAQAKLLVGYSFKRSIQEVMVCIHHQKDLGILQTPYSWGGRTALYEELEEFTFEKYLNTFIIKHYSEVMKKTVTADELNKASSLRAVSADIAANPKIHLIHSLDDFLQSDDDRRWLKNTFGEQVVFFEHGGHLGNLYLAKMHETICEMLK